MSAQPSLLTKADDAQVLLPSNDDQVQVVRDKAAFGLGKFWAYFKNGTKELIGGPGGGGISIESGAFTLAADGMSATGGVLTNPGANPTLTITTTKRLKLCHLNTLFSDGSLVIFSYGKDDGVLADCVNSATVTATQLTNSMPTFSVSINIIDKDFTDGWNGNITAITPTSFSITFNQVGSGRDISNQWHGIM